MTPNFCKWTNKLSVTLITPLLPLPYTLIYLHKSFTKNVQISSFITDGVKRFLFMRNQPSGFSRDEDYILLLFMFFVAHWLDHFAQYVWLTNCYFNESKIVIKVYLNRIHSLIYMHTLLCITSTLRYKHTQTHTPESGCRFILLFSTLQLSWMSKGLWVCHLFCQQCVPSFQRTKPL